MWALGDLLGLSSGGAEAELFHGLDFTTTRGTMQDGLVSPTLFNVVVENIIKTWLTMTV